MSKLKWRLATIVVALIASTAFLFPRDVTVRRRGDDGVLQEFTERRVPLKLGLDLQGGMHLALELDESKQVVADKEDALNRALTVVRSRIDGFGVSEPVVAREGLQIIVELPGVTDQERARAVVQDQAFLEFKMTDRTEALERVLPRLDAVIKERKLAPVTSTAATPTATKARGLEGLLKAADTGTKTDTKGGTKSPVRDSAQARADSVAASGGALSNLVQQGGRGLPGEYLVESGMVARVTAFLEDSAVRASFPPAKSIQWGTDSVEMAGKMYRTLYVLDTRAIMTGDHLEDARPNTDPLEGTIVQFELDNVGGRRFRTETGKNVGNHMAIVLDGRVIGRPPVLQSAISTRGQITMGGKDLAAAQDLALVLRAGALPVPLRVAEVRSIGPSLGEDSIAKGMRAGLLGIAMVIVIMIGYYRFSGVLSVAGLIFYAITTLAFLTAFDATLTLPGIAGFILSIGMAVDANFLQFERIREELDRGKTVRTAVDEGFKNSWAAIIDTHVTTALTGAVLYQYGTGPVRGFAVTLVAGVVSSILSSVFVVRTLFLLWLTRSRGNQPLSI
jgi:preprotein translocase subunit SecD